MVTKRGQVSFEYLILMGFVTFVLSILIGLAFFYTAGVQDRIRITQANNFANKLVSTAEYVFSAGAPSKTTMKVYLPEGVKDVNISENILFVSIQTSSGLNKLGFPSSVNISGSITSIQGLKKIEVVAENDGSTINQV